MFTMKLKKASKPVFAGILILSWCVASGEDVSVPSLAACVAQFEDDVDLGVRLCQAKRDRSVLMPGSSPCAGSWRFVDGRVSCAKSDSASEAAAAGVEFSRYGSMLSAPIAIGNLSAFYADMRAGDHFRVNGRGDGGVEILDSREGSTSDGKCIFPPDTHRCAVTGTFVAVNFPKYARKRTDYTYTLQLDGLLVEEKIQYRKCGTEHCPLGYCFCQSYYYPPPVEREALYLWQQDR